MESRNGSRQLKRQANRQLLGQEADDLKIEDQSRVPGKDRSQIDISLGSGPRSRADHEALSVPVSDRNATPAIRDEDSSFRKFVAMRPRFASGHRDEGLSFFLLLFLLLSLMPNL